MVKNQPANAGDSGSIPGSGRSPRGVNGNPLQYSCLKNLLVHGVAESDTTEQRRTSMGNGGRSGGQNFPTPGLVHICFCVTFLGTCKELRWSYPSFVKTQWNLSSKIQFVLFFNEYLFWEMCQQLRDDLTRPSTAGQLT